MIEVNLNGKPYTLESQVSLEGLLVQVGLSERKNSLAIALNRNIVSREHWQKQLIENRDSIDIIEATQGG